MRLLLARRGSLLELERTSSPQAHRSHRACHLVAFSPGDSLVLTVGGNSSRLWDSRSGRLVHTLIGHSRGVLDGAFTPDGKLIVTTAADALGARVGRRHRREREHSICDTEVDSSSAVEAS